MGKCFFNILATFAEFEVDLLLMRTREGMAIARATGKLKGKAPKLSPTNDPFCSTSTLPATTAGGRPEASVSDPSSRRPWSSVAVRGSLGAMFDHVGIAVSDLAVSERFYRIVLSVLGPEPSHADAELVEWEDWDIGPTDREHSVTRGLHVGFRAPDQATVDAFWQAGINAGFSDAGAPGPRTVYGPDYYGGFLLDPDGNSVEAVHTHRERRVPDGCIDHLWLRVRDIEASRRFYTTIAPAAGLRLTHDASDRVRLSGSDFSFSLVHDERPLTEHVHLAFPADADETVRAFHAAALAAGYQDNGAPGERAVYHRGYYGAFVLDPDGHNVEVVNHNR
jgi:catechol 2,3-dioxygenase-like lactoylglutathione lyase family enzyme